MPCASPGKALAETGRACEPHFLARRGSIAVSYELSNTPTGGPVLLKSFAHRLSEAHKVIRMVEPAPPRRHRTASPRSTGRAPHKHSR